MKRIINLFKFIIKAKKIWTKPNKSKVLIYDYNLSEYFKEKILKLDSEILHLRGETINMFILIKLIKKLKFKNLLLNYSILYIKEVRPKIIITGTDNNLNFYDLQNQIKCFKFKSIVIQNGHRTLTGPDILNYFDSFNDKNYRADFFLCFNKFIGEIYKKMFNLNFIPIGSFLNNINYRLQGDVKTRNFYWISQYRWRKNKKIFDEDSLTYNQKINFENFNIEDYYIPENKIIPIIYEFCEKNNLNLKIMSSYKKNQPECLHEKNFYEKILKHKNWKMTPNEKNDRISVYEILTNDAEYVAHIDSTLGYECLSRGIKTISFLCRKSCYQNVKWIFSWPSNFPNRGLIWTDVDESDEVYRLLNQILKIDNRSWQKYWNSIIPKIMDNDPKNQKFVELINDLISKAEKI